MQRKILVAIFAIAFLVKVQAQNADFRNTLSVHTGASLFNVFKGDLPAISTDSVKYSSGGFSHVPTIGVAWDYGLKKWFSIGVAASFTSAKVEVNDLEIRNNKGTFDKLGNFGIKVPRTTLSTRFLFHYANSKRFDLYTGFRLGVGLWSVKTTGNISNDELSKTINEIEKEFNLPEDAFPEKIEVNLKSRTPFALLQTQFIPFGIRGYVTENIGINGELAIGSPYFASIGLNYRF